MVSVILPTYNGLEYISESIESILNQTYRDIELVIVNDGSTDDISDVINYYLKDKRVKYYEKSNGGTADALNYGIDRATGSTIMFSADDDVSLPNKVELGLKALRGCDFGYTGYYHANPKAEPWQYVSPKPLTEDNIINNDCCSGEAFVFTRKLWEKIPFRNLRVNEDMAWLVDAYKHGIKSNFIDKPTFLYRMLPTGLSYSKKEEVDKISLELVRELNEKKVKNFRIK
jgi:glycosyltransferase involved in cell wall biosynthesis